MGSSIEKRYAEGSTGLLSKLRESAGLNKEQAAAFFGVDRNVYANWESGKSRPHSPKRGKFINFLVDKLQLRKDHNELIRIWNLLMRDTWGWGDLTPQEYTFYNIIPMRVAQETAPLYYLPPTPTTDIVGRDKTLTELRQALFTHSCVALYGIPGVGKTALATTAVYDQQIRQHFSDGILWARLGKNADPLDQLMKWGAVLKVTVPKEENPSETLPWIEAIQTAIASRRMLIVIDDAWRSEDALLFKVGGADCSHLLTTRMPDIAVYFASSQVIHIEELNEADGLALLSNLASQALKGKRTQAKALVRAVGRLPLALTLLGHYLHIQSLTNTSEGLHSVWVNLQNAESRLMLSQPVAPHEQHPTLSAKTPISIPALISISVDALADSARQLFQILPVFPAKPNTFSLDAAVAVSKIDRTSLQMLRDFGLIEETTHERYTMHQVIHDYAAPKREFPFLVERLVQYFTDYTTAHRAEYELLDQEHQNILAAMNSASKLGMQSELLKITTAYSSYLELRSYYRIADQYLQRALSIAKSFGSIGEQLACLNSLGRISQALGENQKAEAYLLEGLAIAEQNNDTTNICDLYRNLGRLAYVQGDFARAERFWKKSLTLAITLNHRENLSALYNNLGIITYNRSDFHQSEIYYKLGLDIAKEIGNKERISGILTNMGNNANRLDEYPKAEATFREGLQIAKEFNLPEIICLMHISLAVVLAKGGSASSALMHAQEAHRIAEENGRKEHLANAYTLFCSIYERQGKIDKAREYGQKALSIASELNHTEIRSITLNVLAGIELKAGNVAIAEQHFIACRKLVSPNDFHFIWTDSLNTQGKLFFAKQDFKQSLEIYQQALDVAQKAGYRQLAAEALWGLAKVAAANNNLAEACNLGNESLQSYEQIGHFIKADVKEWLAALDCPT